MRPEPHNTGSREFKSPNFHYSPSPALRPLCALLILSCALVGCGTLKTYPGPRVASTGVARIRPTDAMFGTSIRIRAVDGIPLSLLQGRAELLPGSHRILGSSSFGFIGAKTHHDFALRFDAQAGRHYAIFAEMYAYGPRIWIADDDLHTVAELDPGLAMLPDEPAGSDSAYRANANRP